MKSLDSFNQESLTILEKNDLLQPLIKSVLIKNTLSQVSIDDQLKKTTIESFKEKKGLNNLDESNDWLSKLSIDNNDLEDLALSKIRLKNYCQEHFSHKVDARFLERKNDLDIIVYSMIRINDYYKAREIYLRLSSGEEEFGNLAARFSEGFESKTRGVVGPIPVSSAHPRLIPVLMGGKEGELQPPIAINGMQVIVRIESYDAAKLDSSMREQISVELFHQWIDEQTTELKNQLFTQILDKSKAGQ